MIERFSAKTKNRIKNRTIDFIYHPIQTINLILTHSSSKIGYI